MPLGNTFRLTHYCHYRLFYIGIKEKEYNVGGVTVLQFLITAYNFVTMTKINLKSVGKSENSITTRKHAFHID